MNIVNGEDLDASIPRLMAVYCADCDRVFNIVRGSCTTCATKQWSPIIWDARYIIGTIKREERK